VKRPPKTFAYVQWPDGHLSPVRRRGRLYWFHVPPRPGSMGGECGCETMADVEIDAVDHGCKLVRRPNPNYEAELAAWHRNELRRTFGRLLGGR
jgi:hypothetical protein